MPSRERALEFAGALWLLMSPEQDDPRDVTSQCGVVESDVSGQLYLKVEDGEVLVADALSDDVLNQAVDAIERMEDVLP